MRALIVAVQAVFKRPSTASGPLEGSGLAMHKGRRRSSAGGLPPREAVYERGGLDFWLVDAILATRWGHTEVLAAGGDDGDPPAQGREGQTPTPVGGRRCLDVPPTRYTAHSRHWARDLNPGASRSRTAVVMCPRVSVRVLSVRLNSYRCFLRVLPCPPRSGVRDPAVTRRGTSDEPRKWPRRQSAAQGSTPVGWAEVSTTRLTRL